MVSVQQMLVQLYPCKLGMLRSPLERQIKESFFVIIAEGMDTRKTRALSCMAIHLGGRK
jgi:hypothetical protein